MSPVTDEPSLIEVALEIVVCVGVASRELERDEDEDGEGH